jgi:hypothetical protein
LQTGWNSLGTFGRVFRDVNGHSPSEWRALENARRNDLARVPHCFVSAAYRPDITTAVSEKRRRERTGKKALTTNRSSYEPGYRSGGPVCARSG